MILVISVLALVSAAVANDELGANQLLQFLNEHEEPAGIIHNSYGYPVTYEEANLGINRDSNLLLNHYIYESMSSFSLERLPPRPVHANGCGAKGYFEVTHDVSSITNVKAFNTIGKKTPLIARFSTTSGEIGSSEVKERGKGFAIRFYTEEGNFDLVGASLSVFTIKDPTGSMAFGHSLKANPKTGIRDTTMSWEFIANRPETLYGSMQPLTPAGQPDSYRHIPAWTVHTFQVENDNGDVNFVRFNWFPDDGIHNLTNAQLGTLMGTRPDYLTEELYDSISNGTYPSWTLNMQVVAKADIDSAPFDLFDVTLDWPEDQYPSQPIGKFVLNEHVQNHFAEVEQLAFNVGNLVPGIRGVDKIFEARIFCYRESQIHRLGMGFNKIEVNCPLNKPQTYNRDGNPPVGDNGGDAPNYYPNSFHGLVPLNKTLSPLYRPVTDPTPNNFWQAANYYKGLSEADRTALVNNIGGSLATIPAIVRDKVLATIGKVDAGFLSRVNAVIAAVQASG